MRHSGLLAALGNDDTPYAKDAWTVPDSAGAAADRRAPHRWLSHPFGPRDLITDMPVPDGLDLATLVDVVERGRRELTNMFVLHGETVRQPGPATSA